MARKDESEKKPSKRRKRVARKGGKAASRKESDGFRLAAIDYRQMYALSKEQRVRMFAILVRQVASPKQLAVELGLGLSQVSYHVGVLRESGAIELVGKAQRRGAVEHFYRATKPMLDPLEFSDQSPPLGVVPVRVDARGEERLGVLVRDFLESVVDLQAEVDGRAPKDDELVSAAILLGSILLEDGSGRSRGGTAGKGRR